MRQEVEDILMINDERIAVQHRLHSSEKLPGHRWADPEKILDLPQVDIWRAKVNETTTYFRNSICPGVALLHSAAQYDRKRIRRERKPDSLLRSADAITNVSRSVRGVFAADPTWISIG